MSTESESVPVQVLSWRGNQVRGPVRREFSGPYQQQAREQGGEAAAGEAGAGVVRFSPVIPQPVSRVLIPGHAMFLMGGRVILSRTGWIDLVTVGRTVRG